MFGEMQPVHWAIVIGVAIVLFGARRLPEAARSLGRSARILKAEISGLHDEQPPQPGTNPDTAHPTSPVSATSAAASTATDPPRSGPSEPVLDVSRR
jgi:sec-independent protein translocase protein TatA